MSSRFRKSAMLLGLMVALAALWLGGSSVWRSTLEERYLAELTSASPDSRVETIERLARVGGERALWRLYDDALIRLAPFYMLRRGLPGYGGTVTAQSEPFPHHLGAAYASAIRALKERIGRERARESGLKYLADPGESLRARVYLAQQCVLGSNPLERLSPELQALVKDRPADDMLLDELRSASIRVLVEALSSGDQLFRQGAAFILGFCNAAEHGGIVPALTQARDDPDGETSEAAIESLVRIEAAARQPVASE